MTIYYRVNLNEGIATETQKVGHYSKSEELNKTVFKSLRAAKRKFNEITKAEVKRLHDLRITVRAMSTRTEVLTSNSEAQHAE